MVTTLRIVIYGRVQMVGFRQFTADKAKQYGIRGQVRNMTNGTVECIATADQPTLEKFIADLKKGPFFSRVDKVETTEVDIIQSIDFRIVR
ncbi:MAG: acylphosphatase [Leptonema sp. (in: Bacteria)]|nr:acylphosphatase [Leptonema sp. (in: bacteria)]